MKQGDRCFAMLKNMKVQDWMNYHVITISATASLRVAEALMKEYNIRHLPVVKGDKLVGILSSGDIRRAQPSDATSLSIWELHYLWDQLIVDGAMTHRAITTTADTPVIDAVRLMLNHRFNCLPVINSNDQLSGILTEVDVFRLLIHASGEISQSVAT